MRVDIKKRPLTDEARRRLVIKVNRMSNDLKKQIELLHTATDNCWLTVWNHATNTEAVEQVSDYQAYVDSIMADIEEE